MSEEQLILSVLNRLELQSKATIDRLTDIEIRQEGMRVELHGAKQEMAAGFQGTHRRLDVSNGRHNKNEERIEALESRNHDADTAASARRQQRDEVKRRAFGLLSALDNKLVTTLVLLALLAAGWIGRGLAP